MEYVGATNVEWNSPPICHGISHTAPSLAKVTPAKNPKRLLCCAVLQSLCLILQQLGLCGNGHVDILFDSYMCLLFCISQELPTRIIILPHGILYHIIIPFGLGPHNSSVYQSPSPKCLVLHAFEPFRSLCSCHLSGTFPPILLQPHHHQLLPSTRLRSPSPRAFAVVAPPANSLSITFPAC